MTNDSNPPEAAVRTSEEGIRCDFCEDVVTSVRRVALHGDYERLRTRHPVQYACPSCFEKKDKARLGVDRTLGPG